jgi:integrin beta 3
MQASEKLFLQTVGRFIAERFKVWIAPIAERIEKQELLMAAYAQREIEVQRMVESTVANYLVAQQLFGRDDVNKMIAAAIEKIPAGPAGKDGKDGVDGADGKSVTAADLDGIMDAKIIRAVADRPAEPHVVSGYVDRVGDLYFTNSDGSNFKVGHVVGADADPAKIAEAIKAECAKMPPPKDGKDGFSLDDFDVQFDGKRTITLRFVDKDNIPLERKIMLAVPLYCGVWREGAYQCGDCATHEGSTWIALADTSTRPGTLNCDWQLANKKGRDGREGKPGPQGPAGKDGRDGRDLTQLGPDGKKW